MSCKNLKDTWHERGKHRSYVSFDSKHAYKPVRNKLKVKIPQLKPITEEYIDDLYDFDYVSLPNQLLAYKHNRFEDWKWYGGPVERLVEKYLDKPIALLHKKCMSYGKKYAHKIWEKVTWKVHMLADGSYDPTLVYKNGYYVDEVGVLRKGRYTFTPGGIDLETLTHKRGTSMYYLEKGKSYFFTVGGKKVENICVVDTKAWSRRYSSYWGEISISGWYQLVKEQDVVEHKVLFLNSKGGPVFGVDGPAYSIREEIKERYVLKHMWWNKALQQNTPFYYRSL